MKHWLSQIELGKWYSNAQYYYRPRNDKERNLMHNCYEEGYNKGYEDGKPNWHDLRKDPNDLPKESNKYLCAWEGGEQWIMDFETEVNSFGYWCNIYDNQSLGFIDSVFETIKERGEDEVIAWCELPKFEE